MNALITIDTFTIKQDTQGRYCLNDLHKASGGRDKDKPSNYLRQESAEELIKVLGAENLTPVNRVIGKGKEQGTFVVKELVYAYAMWISVSFQLKVIRAFDTLQTQGVAVAEHAAEDFLKNPLKYCKALFEQAEELQARLLVAQPKADVFDALVAHRDIAVGRFVKSLEGSDKVNLIKVKASLGILGYLFKKGSCWRVYREHQNLFKEKVYGETGAYEIYPTEEGKKLIVQLLRKGKLITKK